MLIFYFVFKSLNSAAGFHHRFLYAYPFGIQLCQRFLSAFEFGG